VTIDRDPVEWGPAVVLTGNWSYEYNNENSSVTWVPNIEVKFIVEDNRNLNYPLISGDPFLVPYIGIHIKGKGNNYLFYDEPKLTRNDGTEIVEPFGYELYDNEAMYFQQESNFVYILIVTSTLPGVVGDEAPGDLRININKTIDSGDGYPYVPVNLTAIIISGTKLGTANGAYVMCANCIGAIDTEIEDFSINDNCTNDVLISIPEFEIVALPIAGLFGLVYELIIRTKER
jgi:hypothetical protein